MNQAYRDPRLCRDMFQNDMSLIHSGLSQPFQCTIYMGNQIGLEPRTLRGSIPASSSPLPPVEKQKMQKVTAKKEKYQKKRKMPQSDAMDILPNPEYEAEDINVPSLESKIKTLNGKISGLMDQNVKLQNDNKALQLSNNVSEFD
jgi:hypothetical protein